MKRNKLVTSAVALGTAAALALGGTFAWQSMNQTAVNEASNIVNPGGRLHDDFNGENKDIYVENFADEAIFARVRLEEYFEVVMNFGDEDSVTTSEVLIGAKTEKQPVTDEDEYEDVDTLDDGEDVTDDTTTGEIEWEYTYVPFDFTGHVNEDGTVRAANIENLDTKVSMTAEDTENGVETKADEDNNILSYWQWTMGSEKSEDAYYMPTFNMNKDSLVADTNGAYAASKGVITERSDKQYKDYTEYKENDTKEGTEIYDGDDNTVDEVGTDFEHIDQYETAENVILVEETHTAAKIADSKGLISMTAWLEKLEEAGTGDDGELTEAGRESISGYWVYDDSEDGDGWCYWSAPIEEDTTTGRLLDSIKLSQKMDDSWYYAINVVGQFITANDLGDTGIKGEDGTYTGGTGFYADGETVTDNAMTLLTTIGVDAPDLPSIEVVDDKVALEYFHNEYWKGGERDGYNYKGLVELTGGDDSIMHWSGIQTAGDQSVAGASVTVFGGSSATAKTVMSLMNAIYGECGYRPVLKVNTELLPDGIEEGDLYKVGTLYNDGEPVEVQDVPTTDNLEKMGRVTLGKALKASKYQMKMIYIGNGVFVADRCMLTGYYQ